MKTCFGYIRVSTQKQGEGASLEAQKDAITAFASHHNYSITRWFEEKETAAKSGRPIFNQMLRLLQRKAADGLIIHKIDRSARNLKDWSVISDLSDAGVDVYFATESLDFRSRGGRLTADIQAVIAADFIRNLRDETIKGLNGRLKQGLYPFRAPIGYQDNGRGQPKTIDQIKGPLIRQAFDLYATREHSLRSLEKEMARRGLKNQNGKPLSLHGIETILRNPFYCGTIEIKRTGLTYKGIHEPLITARTFVLVQDIKAGRAGKKVTRHNHLYRGLFRCGLCAGPMVPERQKGYVYYRCQNSTCSTKTVREEDIEQAVQDAFRTIQLTLEQAVEFESMWQNWMAGDDRANQIKHIDLRLAETSSRLQRLTDLLIDGTIDKEAFDTRKKGLMLDLSRLEQDRKEANESTFTQEQLTMLLERMKTLAKLHINSKPAEKREMVQNAFSNRRVSGKNVDLEPYNWLESKDFASGVSFGDQRRHTYRTLEQWQKLFGYEGEVEFRPGDVPNLT
jgi:site-specific DNA recombinase